MYIFFLEAKTNKQIFFTIIVDGNIRWMALFVCFSLNDFVQFRFCFVQMAFVIIYKQRNKRNSYIEILIIINIDNG